MFDKLLRRITYILKSMLNIIPKPDIPNRELIDAITVLINDNVDDVFLSTNNKYILMNVYHDSLSKLVEYFNSTVCPYTTLTATDCISYYKQQHINSVSIKEVFMTIRESLANYSVNTQVQCDLYAIVDTYNTLVNIEGKNYG